MANYGYIRTASTKWNENTEENQRAYFEHLKIDEFFNDMGVSGMTTDRPAFNKLIRTVKDGDNIYVREMSRISRDFKTAIQTLKELSKRGVNVFVTTKLENPIYPFFDNDPIERLFLSIVDFQKEFDSEHKSIMEMTCRELLEEKYGKELAEENYGKLTDERFEELLEEEYEAICDGEYKPE